MRTILTAIIIVIGVIPSYSQFYDVKIKKFVHEVNACREATDVNNYLKAENASPQASCPEKRDTVNTPVHTHDFFSEQIYFCSPLDSLVVTSAYGYRSDPFTGKRKFHRGTDYRTHSENVYAIMPGRVSRIGYDKKLGNYITIEHGDLTVTYAHLHTVVGEKGDIVRAGDSIGLSGSTGRSTGEHLHIGMKYKKDWIDPHPILCMIQNMSRGILLSSSE